MAKDDATRILIEFRAGGGASGSVRETLESIGRELAPPWSEGLQEAFRQLSLALGELRGISEAQVEATGENTAAVIQNTVAQVTGRENAASSAGRAVARVFGSGLGVSPLISSLIRLFTGGSGTEPTAVLTPYARPAPIHFEGLVSRTGGATVREPVARDEGWRRRDRGGEATGRPVNITVQVQALDSRSFLEHSDEIARAVREAMLNSHALNDVVTEL